MYLKTKFFPFVLALTVSMQSYAETFSIAYASAWKPISYGDGENVSGILPSLAHMILADEMALPVKHIGMPWKRAQESVRSGAVDAFITTPTDARREFAESTDVSFFALEFRAFARKESDTYKRLQSEPGISNHKNEIRFCDVLGNGWAKGFYRAADVDYFVAPEIEHCLRMISRNRQDAVIHSTAVTSSKLFELGLETQIVRLPQVYHHVDFTLMISKASPFHGALIKRINNKLYELKSNGRYQIFLEKAENSVNP